MIAYRCQFFDAGSNVFGAEILHAENDAAAIARAIVIFAHGIGSGSEIWDGDRLVLRHGHGPGTAKESS